MLDFEIVDGKIFWKSEITEETVKKEISQVKAQIRTKKNQINYNLEENKRLLSEIEDLQATLANAKKVLKQLAVEKGDSS